MEHYFISILAFIGGGGITTLLSARYIRKTSKVDAADKICHFYEDQLNKMLKRIEDLENAVAELKDVSCIRVKCRLRER